MRVTGIEGFYRNQEKAAGVGDREVGILIGRTDLTREQIKDMMKDGYKLYLRRRTDTHEEVQAAKSALREMAD